MTRVPLKVTYISKADLGHYRICLWAVAKLLNAVNAGWMSHGFDPMEIMGSHLSVIQ